jgi:hypothetical protein
MLPEVWLPNCAGDSSFSRYLVSISVGKTSAFDIAMEIDNISSLQEYHVEFVADKGSAAHTRLVGLPVSHMVAGDWLRFHIAQHDAFGNLCALQSEPPTITLKGLREDAGTALVCSFAGSTTVCELRPTHAGAYSLEVLVSGAPVRGSPFEFRVHAGMADWGNSMFSVLDGASNSSAPGAPIRLRLRVLDRYGNPCEDISRTAVDRIDLEVLGLNKTDFNVTSNGDGAFDASFSLTRTGNYTVFVLLNGVSLLHSPFSWEITAGSAEA